VERSLQVAQLENCLGDDALTLLEGFQFDTEEEERTVDEIIQAFQVYAVGQTNDTLERYKLGTRVQQEGETIDKWLTDLRIMIKSCDYCSTCEPSILRDRIVLGIRCEDTREELLKTRKLDLNNCIDICRAKETAASHGNRLKSDSGSHSINRVEDDDKKKKPPMLRQECRFCPYTHILVKEKCPAWGKSCEKCGKKNHFAVKCSAASPGRQPSAGDQPSKK
jgi:hypothetical protein